MNALVFQDLGFAYRPGQWILRGYSGTLGRGQVGAVLGPNGCGKTTLLKVLIGALLPQEGEIAHEGRFAFVPQQFQVNFDYTVLDVAILSRCGRIGRFSDPSPRAERAGLAALERFGLGSLAARGFQELSAGQRQQVVLAGALAGEAEILVLDEPDTSLDLQRQGILLEWLRHAAREEGRTVLFTTRNPQNAHAVADTTLLMQGPRPPYWGPTRTALSERRLSMLYGVDLRRTRIQHRGRRSEAIVPFAGPGL